MPVRSNKMLFREAQKADIERIVEIHNSNVIKKQPDPENQGFLLEEITIAKVIDRINSSNSQYFVATNKDNSILGYVELQYKIDEAILTAVVWMDINKKELILTGKYFYIAVVATSPNLTGSGIAQFLYNGLYLRFPYIPFIAFVAVKPINNRRSVDFHIKQGFDIVGNFRTNHFCGLNNYESVLFFKALQDSDKNDTINLNGSPLLIN